MVDALACAIFFAAKVLWTISYNMIRENVDKETIPTQITSK
jgi:hypothetical protein